MAHDQHQRQKQRPDNTSKYTNTSRSTAAAAAAHQDTVFIGLYELAFHDNSSMSPWTWLSRI